MTRYKAKPITPVDAVVWKGDNVAEIQALCPEVIVYEDGVRLGIPVTELGPKDLSIGNVLMRNVAGGTYTILNSDIFNALYVVQ